MAMIHLIVLDTVDFGKATFVIENIAMICAEEYYTQIWISTGKYFEVKESVEEIVKRINQTVYGTKE